MIQKEIRMSNGIVPGNYQNLHLANIWGEFIDWEKRRKGENGFLVRALQEYGAKTVLEASLGDGCDSIYLIKQGFDVTSNELDSVFRETAIENARKENVDLKITTLDWRALDAQFSNNHFDAVILLGNSITYLFTKQDQLAALRQFKKILKLDGVLIIDERNYQYILDHRNEIAAGKFEYSGKYVYCGERVHARPIEIHDDSVIFEYRHQETGERGTLTMYPFKRGELRQRLRESGFVSIQQFSDYKEGENGKADFYQYVCQ
ncbi:class I SAM-dependent methyltransferase [Candidatus Uhrbacteria bacterium]|nr:class I SAM-dependent methyltransferase [Candidatus Uhrbacteria bacterium]